MSDVAEVSVDGLRCPKAQDFTSSYNDGYDTTEKLINDYNVQYPNTVCMSHFVLPMPVLHLVCASCFVRTFHI